MFKKYIPIKVKYIIKRFLNDLNRKGDNKIFCVSVQKTGTTSVGDFFKHFGYPVARWYDSTNSNWSKFWHDGDFESIFKSKNFQSYQVFEDGPWWYPEFYKVLYHRFPNSKFILFVRDSDSWYKSMIAHSKKGRIGDSKEHCKIYRREIDFYHKLGSTKDSNDKLDKFENHFSMINYKEHYKNIYEIRNREIIDFFNEQSPKSLIVCKLEDPHKWEKLGEFMEIQIPKDFKIHSNKSVKQN